MTKIGRNSDFLERSVTKLATRTVESDTRSIGTRGRPNIKDDFVIPHVGPEISDDEVLSFAESLAEKILHQQDRAVIAQANQERERVVALTKQ